MRIVHKLFLLLALSAVGPVAVVGTALVWRSAASQRNLLESISNTWGLTKSAGQEALFDQASRAHLQLVEDKAATVERGIEIIRRAVQLQAELTRQALFDEPWAELPPLYDANLAADLFNDKTSEFARAYAGKKDYAVFRTAPGVSTTTAKPILDRLLGLTAVLSHNQHTLPWCKSTYIGHESGVILGYPGGGRFPPDYDPRTKYWYQKAARHKTTIWTKMYRDKDDVGSVVTYACPVLSGNAKVIAVAAVDIDAEALIKELFVLRGLPVSDALIVDQKGQVRASSSSDGLARGIIHGKATIKPPTLAKYKDGAFSGVFRKMLASPEKRSGLLMEKGNLFTYARIEIGKDREEGERSDVWYYIVVTPTDPFLKPVDQIARSFSGLQQGLAASIDAEQRRQLLHIASILAAVLLLAGLLAVTSARSAAVPLARVTDALRRISGGDYDARLPAASKDEIGQVEAEINAMAEGLKQGRVVKATFQRYVAPSVVQRLLENPEQMALGGERRQMTVFFSDLEGFTSLAERLSPEALVELLNEYLSAMTLCLFAEEGTVDKYEGDAIMAFWGAPLDQADHALRACRAALDTFKALEALNGKWVKQGLTRLDMRVGLSSGSMVVGNIGSMMKMDYTAIGDSVNLGSRMEGANKHYGTRIMISEDTFRQAGPAVVTRELDLLTVVGRKHAERAYELVGLSGQVPEAKLAALKDFEAGLAAYRAARWDEAEAAFTRAGDDPPSKVFLERVARLRSVGVPKDWDGVFVMDRK